MKDGAIEGTVSGTRDFDRGQSLQRIGGMILRWGLVLLLLWIGALKFTKYEADGIQMLAKTSPFLS